MNNAPWLKFYDGIRHTIDYPNYTLSEALYEAGRRAPYSKALVYMNKAFSFRDLMKGVEKTQAMLYGVGIRPGDRIAVCLPNIPQAVFLLYAADRMGAVVSFLHPLSAPVEFSRYFEELDASCVVALDTVYSVVSKAFEKTGKRKLILTGATDELGKIKRVLYNKGKKAENLSYGKEVYLWSELKRDAVKAFIDAFTKSPDDTAVVLFSGGTTGEPKGVMLSAKGLNAMAMQTAEMSHCKIKGRSMLGAMPMFHGFGLGVCVHTALIHGASVVLVPRFTAKEYVKVIKKYRPNFIAGVPTLFEALLREPEFDKLELSFLWGVFSGGDSLPLTLKKKFDGFLKAHGANVRIREGYGATECVTASCLTPYNTEREGSIGIPFPDTYYKICKAGTIEEVPTGVPGEICIHGPALMKGYLNAPEETEKVLRVHEDSKLWLHTGDVGFMDNDGFVYFKSRLKRMIVSRGYNIYPQSIERAIEQHPSVEKSCVVGVKDAYKMQRIKAYVVKKDEITQEVLRKELYELCREHIARFAIPSEIVFTDSLPYTKSGKIAYTLLEEA